MKYVVTVADTVRTIEVDESGVRVDGRRVAADVARRGDSGVLSVLLDGVSHVLVAERAGRGTWRVQTAGRREGLEVLDERAAIIRQLSGAAGSDARARAVKAPMPGMVVKVEVDVGDEVEPGQGLVIVEAMKMENELKAVAPGVVAWRKQGRLWRRTRC